RVGGHVLHASEGRQQVLHVPVRRPAVARPGRDGGAAVPLLWCAHAQGWGCRGSRMTLPAPAPGPWQHWDLHPSVIIGLVLLGGLYVYWRSEEHTSELQSRGHLVCRLLLEKKKKRDSYC